MYSYDSLEFVANGCKAHDLGRLDGISTITKACGAIAHAHNLGFEIEIIRDELLRTDAIAKAIDVFIKRLGTVHISGLAGGVVIAIDRSGGVQV